MKYKFHTSESEDTAPVTSLCVLVAQLCPTLCDPMDFRTPGRPLCPSSTPRACSNPCPWSRWCHPTISPSVVHFSSDLQSFPHQGLFQWNLFSTYMVIFCPCLTQNCSTSKISKSNILLIPQFKLFMLSSCCFNCSHCIYSPALQAIGLPIQYEVTSLPVQYEVIFSYWLALNSPCLLFYLKSWEFLVLIHFWPTS